MTRHASIDSTARPAADPPRRRARTIPALVLLACVLGAASASTDDEPTCEIGATLAGGDPDPTIFGDRASRGIRATWCERYDRFGNTTRTGPYREMYPGGALRTEARYVKSRLQGPVTIRNEDGGLFSRGLLVDGEWVGELEIYHPNGALWLSTHFDHGVLDGATRTHYADGSLESETHFQNGREDGLARSFYPSSLGGRLKSEAFVEADRIVGPHRVLDYEGNVLRSIDWDTGPIAWRRPRLDPAAPNPPANRAPASPPGEAADRANPPFPSTGAAPTKARRELRD